MVRAAMWLNAYVNEGAGYVRGQRGQHPGCDPQAAEVGVRDDDGPRYGSAETGNKQECIVSRLARRVDGYSRFGCRSQALSAA